MPDTTLLPPICRLGDHVRWVHPSTHEIFKFLPNNPPKRGDVVLVDGERCRVLRCAVSWDGRIWQMGERGVKVRPEPLKAVETAHVTAHEERHAT